jgi:hypothetical protein
MASARALHTPTDYSANVSGALNAYMLVNDLNQLQAISTNLILAGTYALGRDIDASATSGWNSGAGFSPLGSDHHSSPASSMGSVTPFPTSPSIDLARPSSVCSAEAMAARSATSA